MPRLPKPVAFLGALFLSIASCPADDQARLQVTVSKKTIVRPASRSTIGDERGRIQTLVLSAQNRSIRALPAGEVAWTAVLRKQSSGSYKYSGAGKLAPMLSFQSAELQFGTFEVDARQTGTTVERDKIDYEVVIFHAGKETYRTTSVSNFAALAAAAQSMGIQEDVPAAAVEKGEIAVPAKPAAAAPVEAGKMPPVKSDLPIAEVMKTPVEPPPVPQQPFDFFNLGGKKASEAK